MSRSNSRPDADVPPATPTGYERSLAARHLDPLLADPVAALLTDMRDRLQANDVSLEISALHLILYRLLAEHHDLPSLAPLVTRVVSVAMQAARVRRTLDGQGSEKLLDAIATILDELAASQP